MKKVARFFPLIVALMAVAGCAEYEMDNHEVLSVVRFRDSSYVDYVLLPKGVNDVRMNRLSYTDASVYADEVLSVEELS